jgi:hypothetical protein
VRALLRSTRSRILLTGYKAVPTSVADAFQAALIAKALTQSFRTGKPVDFGDDGEPIL